MTTFQYGRLYFGSANIVWDTGDKEADKEVLATLKAASSVKPSVQQAPSAISMLNAVGALGWEVVHISANGVEAILKRPIVVQPRVGQTASDQSTRQPTSAKV
jgi:hypothetical protein